MHHVESGFPCDYADSRARFLEAAEEVGVASQSHPVEGAGPGGEPLVCDAARLGPENPAGLVIVSSGLHGVEAFVGGAVQIALLRALAGEGSLPPETGVLLLHALNPYGFAHLRRCEAGNIDPNRNLLPPGEAYAGSPLGYGRLDRLLNPCAPPRRFDGFLPRALFELARLGREQATTAIAGGQHDFPQGLFYGGSGPGACHRLLSAQYSRWVGGARRVLHLDFHTGLGAWGTHEVITNRDSASPLVPRLREVFGPRLTAVDRSVAVRYTTRGDLNSWCDSQVLGDRGAALCVEFGTYRPLRVLAALRRENQAHHYSEPGAPDFAAAKRGLREAFAPASPQWRRRVLEAGLQLVQRALRGVSETGWGG